MLGKVSCAGMVLVALAGCQATGVSMFGERPEQPSVSMRIELPEWWEDEPRQTSNVIAVCAMADGEDLFTARRLAMEGVEAAFERASGVRPRDAAVQSDSVRLRDGEYRVYVRMSGAAGRATAGEDGR